MAFPYTSSYTPAEGADRVARYALGDDYHEALRKRLKPVAALLRASGYQARVCVDSAPILERYWALRCGLGVLGRDHQVIIPGLGSYFFLAEIVTDRVAEGATRMGHTGRARHDYGQDGTNGDDRARDSANGDRGGCDAGGFGCEGCGACLRACPTGALGADGSFDARLCVNYLTIEHRGELPATLTVRGRSVPTGQLLRGVLYGCDRCQECCPHNRPGRLSAAPLAEFEPRPWLLHATAAALAAMDPGERALLLRRSPLRRGLNRR